jgi:hypothetical protein
VRRLLILAIAPVAAAAAAVAVHGALTGVQTPTPAMPILGGERSPTAPSATPISTFKTFRATAATKLYSISGSVTAAYRRAAPGRVFGQVLYSFWVCQNDPGPGPFATGYVTFQAACGVVAWPGNVIQKIEAEPYVGASESMPVYLDFNGAPILIPSGAYLVLVADYAMSSEAGTGATDYGQLNYEAMLNATVDRPLDRVTPP